MAYIPSIHRLPSASIRTEFGPEQRLVLSQCSNGTTPMARWMSALHAIWFSVTSHLNSPSSGIILTNSYNALFQWSMGVVALILVVQTRKVMVNGSRNIVFLLLFSSCLVLWSNNRPRLQLCSRLRAISRAIPYLHLCHRLPASVSSAYPSTPAGHSLREVILESLGLIDRVRLQRQGFGSGISSIE